MKNLFHISCFIILTFILFNCSNKKEQSNSLTENNISVPKTVSDEIKDYNPKSDREEIIKRHDNGNKELVRGYCGQGSNEQKVYDWYYDREGNLSYKEFYINGKRHGKWIREDTANNKKYYSETIYENGQKKSFLKKHTPIQNVNDSYSDTQFEYILYDNNEKEIYSKEMISGKTFEKIKEKQKEVLPLTEFEKKCIFKNDNAKKKFSDFFNSKQNEYIFKLEYSFSSEKKDTSEKIKTTHSYIIFHKSNEYNYGSVIAEIDVSKNADTEIKSVAYLIDETSDNIFVNPLYKYTPPQTSGENKNNPMAYEEIFFNNKKFSETTGNQHNFNYKGFYYNGSLFCQIVSDKLVNSKKYPVNFFDKNGNKIWNIEYDKERRNGGYTQIIYLSIKQYDGAGKEINSANYEIENDIINGKIQKPDLLRYPLYNNFIAYLSNNINSNDIFPANLYHLPSFLYNSL